MHSIIKNFPEGESIPKERLQDCTAQLNSINKDLQFTYESEKNNTLPFLDLLIVNERGQVRVNYYTKPTSSGRLVNFHSYHPYHQKIGVIKQFLHKIHNVCSDQYKEESVAKLKERLRLNSYPEQVINDVINTFEVEDNSGGQKNENMGNRKFIRMPYHCALAPRLKRIFKDTDSCLAFYNVRSSKRFYSKVKDKVPPLKKANVVYEVTCSCNKSYIGQTKQYLKTRLEQHKGDIRKFQGKTGLSQHVIEAGHTVDWGSVRVLKDEPCLVRRSFYEMAHITKNNNSLNVQTDFNDFNGTYQNVIKKFC